MSLPMLLLLLLPLSLATATSNLSPTEMAELWEKIRFTDVYLKSPSGDRVLTVYAYEDNPFVLPCLNAPEIPKDGVELEWLTETNEPLSPQDGHRLGTYFLFYAAHKRHAGQYRCKVAQSYSKTMDVVVLSPSDRRFPMVTVQEKQSISVTCQSLGPNVVWNHDERVIYSNAPGNPVSLPTCIRNRTKLHRELLKLKDTVYIVTATLNISQAQMEDSGLYTLHKSMCGAYVNVERKGSEVMVMTRNGSLTLPCTFGYMKNKIIGFAWEKKGLGTVVASWWGSLSPYLTTKTAPGFDVKPNLDRLRTGDASIVFTKRQEYPNHLRGVYTCKILYMDRAVSLRKLMVHAVPMSNPVRLTVHPEKDKKPSLLEHEYIPVYTCTHPKDRKVRWRRAIKADHISPKFIYMNENFPESERVLLTDGVNERTSYHVPPDYLDGFLLETWMECVDTVTETVYEVMTHARNYVRIPCQSPTLNRAVNWTEYDVLWTKGHDQTLECLYYSGLLPVACTPKEDYMHRLGYMGMYDVQPHKERPSTRDTLRRSQNSLDIAYAKVSDEGGYQCWLIPKNTTHGYVRVRTNPKIYVNYLPEYLSQRKPPRTVSSFAWLGFLIGALLFFSLLIVLQRVVSTRSRNEL